MKKKIIQIIIAIVLMFALINILLYNFYIIPKISVLNNKKTEFDEKIKKSDELIIKKNQIEKFEKEVIKLKQDTKDINNLVPYSVDTPQMVYDFYNACKKSNVIGNTISFEINSNDNISSDEKDKVEADKSDDIKDSVRKFTKLEIKLNVIGNKENLFKFINNMNNITERKINVKNIKITSPQNESKALEGQNTDENQNINQNINNNEQIENGNSNQMDISEVSTAEFTLYHYIQIDEDQVKKLKEYKFYNKPLGFKNVEDMFKD